MLKTSGKIAAATLAISLMASTSKAAFVLNGDGLFNINAINTGGPNPGNDTANWLSLWDALDGGAGPTGTVAGYNVLNNVKDTEFAFDYAGGGGDFSLNNSLTTIAGDGPGGGPGFLVAGTGNSNYSIRGVTFIEFLAAGTYSLALGSDDGRRIELTEALAGSAPGYSGFTARGDQVNGAFSPGDTVIGFSGGTGQNQSVGVFSVAAGDILELDAFMYEGGGGDQGEISIAEGSFTTFNSSDFSLLEDGGLGGKINIGSSLAAAIPEPASALIALVGGMILSLRRRRSA